MQTSAQNKMKITRAKVRRKLREWTRRYLAAEICGTAAAFVSFWAVQQSTGSLVFAAVAGTIGEAIGYYSVAMYKDVKHYWRVHSHCARLRRTALCAANTSRDMAIEYGPAEAIDSFLVRPTLFYTLPLMFASHQAAALITAKLLADLVFYMFAIIGYETRGRIFGKPAPVPIRAGEAADLD
jgi:hypothetical protein